VPHTKSFPDSFTGAGDFMKRPAMKALLAYVDANPHKKYVVIFDDLKRFARDVEFHIKLRAAFKARDVLLVCLNYNFDESPEGRFSETIMAAQAELERHQNRRQVIQKQKARLEAGYWTFGGKKG
jgi:DNA invertase Pin-like site-specific DNA recombinase